MDGEESCRWPFNLVWNLLEDYMRNEADVCYMTANWQALGYLAERLPYLRERMAAVTWG